MKRILSLLLLPVLLLACNGGGGDDATLPTETQQERPVGHVINLSAHDLPLLVEIDHQTLGTDTPEVRWNEEFGKLEVNAGDRFRLTIVEEAGDIERLKASLERDMLRRNTLIEDSPGLVVYRSEFPDDTIVFVHFYQVVEHGGRTFVIESHDQGRFNEDDIRRMAASVRPVEQV